MLDYLKTFFIAIYYNVLDWFDTMMMDTGYVVWIGTVFLMITGYRFIIRPLFGIFTFAGASDSIKNYQRYKKDDK